MAYSTLGDNEHGNPFIVCLCHCSSAQGTFTSGEVVDYEQPGKLMQRECSSVQAFVREYWAQSHYETDDLQLASIRRQSKFIQQQQQYNTHIAPMAIRKSGWRKINQGPEGKEVCPCYLYTSA